MSRAVKGVLVSLVLLVVLIGGAIIWLGWQLRAQPPDSALPEIAKNLPHNGVAEADRAFKERVHIHFSAEKSSLELIQKLRSEGFHMGNKDRKGEFVTAGTDDHVAWLTQSGFPCDRSWLVLWHEHDGHVENLTAHYQPECF